MKEMDAHRRVRALMRLQEPRRSRRPAGIAHATACMVCAGWHIGSIAQLRASPSLEGIQKFR